MVLGLVCLPGCAAPGYHFNTGEFHQTPNDPCQRQEVRSAGAVNWLNMKVGAPDGPPKRVVSIQSPSGSGYGGTLTCRAFLVFEDGTTRAGQLTVIDPGGAAPLSVSWTSDPEAAGQRQVGEPQRSPPAQAAQPAHVSTEPAYGPWGWDYPTMVQQESQNLSPQARVIFNRNRCIEVEGRINRAVTDYRRLRSQGYTQHQAVDYMVTFLSTLPEVAEFASKIPDSMSPVEAEGTALHNCLHNAAEHAAQ